MNKPEPSATTSYAEAFAERQSYVCPSSWKDTSEDQSQTYLFHHGDGTTAMTGIESRNVAVLRDIRELQSTEVWPESRSEPLDFGFWLFRDAATRYGRWEHLRRATKGTPNTGDSSLRRSSRFVKRCCDVVASVCLLFLLFPLFLLIAVLIKLDSPGPVFFRHFRVGEEGEQFMLWKFRSMKTEVPKYEVSPQSSVDIRLTRVGRVIRRMSIDEIPQLINVLKGEMSLVGPRPEMPFIVAQHHPAGCERLSARPGITGLWQISPARAFPIHENLQYDIHYIRNQNFVLDCAIVLRTITAVIHGVGAI
jgi:lipopolysaccharide/colanic/teichoic acid biosynthesis glycosyltransferase